MALLGMLLCTLIRRPVKCSCRCSTKLFPVLAIFFTFNSHARSVTFYLSEFSLICSESGFKLEPLSFKLFIFINNSIFYCYLNIIPFYKINCLQKMILFRSSVPLLATPFS